MVFYSHSVKTDEVSRQVIALIEIEEERKPQLSLAIKDVETSLSFAVGEEKPIILNINCDHGELATGISCFLFAPPNFEFPGHESWLQPVDMDTISGYLTAEVKWERLHSVVSQPISYTLKVPPDPDTYKLFHRVVCDGYAGGFVEFEVTVVAEEEGG